MNFISSEVVERSAKTLKIHYKSKLDKFEYEGNFFISVIGIISAYIITSSFVAGKFSKIVSLNNPSFILISVNSFSLSLLYSFQPFLSEMLNIEYLQKLYARYKIKYDIENGKCLVTQSEANQIFSGTKFNIAERTVFLTRCFAFAGYVLVFNYIAAFVILLGLGVNYWGDKYLLLRRHKKPQYAS